MPDERTRRANDRMREAERMARAAEPPGGLMHPTCDYPDCKNQASDDGRCSVHSGTRVAGEDVHHPSSAAFVPEGEQLLIDQVAAVEPPDPAIDPEAPVEPVVQVPTQVQFDEAVVAEILGQMRRQYAILKSRYYLTRAGAPDPTGEEKNHPNQHVGELKKFALAIGELERLLVEGMPAPATLYLAEGGDDGS